jgi:hypothetical protein
MNEKNVSVNIPLNVLWILFIASLVFSLLAFILTIPPKFFYFFPIILLLITFFNIHSKSSIQIQKLSLIPGVILTLLFWFPTLAICVSGYCPNNATLAILFGSISTFFFFSIFIVKSLDGYKRLIVLSLVSLLITWLMLLNGGFDIFPNRKIAYMDLTPYYFFLNALVISGIWTTGLIKGIKKIIYLVLHLAAISVTLIYIIYGPFKII